VTYGISGGPIENFREGWAIIPLIRKPHYWRRRGLTTEYSSLCGMHGRLPTQDELRAHGMPHARQMKPLDPGVFMVDRCKTCRRRREVQARYL